MIQLYIFFQILFHFKLLQSIEYNSLCCSIGLCGLSILYTVVSVNPTFLIYTLLPSPFDNHKFVFFFFFFFFSFFYKCRILLSITQRCDVEIRVKGNGPSMKGSILSSLKGKHFKKRTSKRMQNRKTLKPNKYGPVRFSTWKCTQLPWLN